MNRIALLKHNSDVNLGLPMIKLQQDPILWSESVQSLLKIAGHAISYLNPSTSGLLSPKYIHTKTYTYTLCHISQDTKTFTQHTYNFKTWAFHQYPQEIQLYPLIFSMIPSLLFPSNFLHPLILVSLKFFSSYLTEELSSPSDHKTLT